ncbi:YciE/YciF ferroxidase family protein [Sphingobacterium psychroaquaticum]|uniref:Ferritin-like metal-binding protein YciE n=1 Tax=Sphingobacterium psychroaquaticum TaxID=561061 RepID=A0A1X7IA98_9SPHI|nr:ferritin-like domain-containing protein [Sphingobacterium psychroaquaticum]SMG11637.1 Ferritin-like metal-binding protein YciE [Sphingobacterium psychroaquaticum]
MKRTEKNDMPNGHLHELFVDELKDALSAEKQLLTALKKMQQEATNEELKGAFADHHEQTQEHIHRLKQVFDHLGLAPRAKTCKAMQGLLEEAEEISFNFDGDPIKDAALIAAAQKVEHYEMATYGTLVTYANMMGHKQSEDLLQQTLDEEKETDRLLTDIAVNKANSVSAF